MRLSTTMGMELTYIPTILQAVSEELSPDTLEDIEYTFIYEKANLLQKEY